jgi:hypothetical protein
MTIPVRPGPPTPPRRLALATVGAAAIAAVLLVVAVLPAEYGIDPLGAGRLLGLTPPPSAQSNVAAVAASAEARLIPTPVGPVSYFGRPYASDRASFVLGPYDYVEYKYRLEAGAPVTFSWTASSTVLHDLHAEPDGGAEHAEVSFDRRDLSRAAGTHVAPFPGLHGWMWENPGSTPVTVTIATAGFYTSATEFRPNRRRIEHPIAAAGP